MRVWRFLAGICALELAYAAGVLNTHANELTTMAMMGIAGIVAGYLAA